MCYCGDLYCFSCGPAQGNYRCCICRKWTLDGGCVDSESCNKQLEVLAKAEREFDETYHEANNSCDVD